MIFASKAFLVFLPVVLLLYFAQRSRAAKYRVLLAASWLFYAWLTGVLYGGLKSRRGDPESASAAPRDTSSV